MSNKEFIEFWSKYRDITTSVKKRYIFKRTPFAEAKASYLELLGESRRKIVDYQAQCAMALARCEEGMYQDDSDMSPNNITNVLHEKEKAKRRTEFARLFFASEDASIVLLHSAYCASFPQLSSLSLTSESELSLAPFPPIPVHLFLILSQLPTAVQSYFFAIKLYDKSKKANISSSLLYELAVQLQKTGDLGTATILWEQAAYKLLLQQVSLPSRTLSVNSRIVSKDIKRKPSSRAPITAYCALHRALVSNVHSSQFKKATKNASQIVDIILEDKNFIPGGNEKLIESLVSLTLLYTLKRDFPKAHKTLQSICKHSGGFSSKSSWQIGLDSSNEFIICLFDIVTCYNEMDLDCIEELAEEIFPLLTCVQQEILLILLEQSKF